MGKKSLSSVSSLPRPAGKDGLPSEGQQLAFSLWETKWGNRPDVRSLKAELAEVKAKLAEVEA